MHYPNLTQPNLTPPLPQPNLDLNSSCIVSSWKVTFHSKISMTLIAMLSLLIIKTYTWTLISTSNMNLNLNLDLNITFTWVPWLIISVQQANKCLIWLYKREVKVHLKQDQRSTAPTQYQLVTFSQLVSASNVLSVINSFSA